MSNLFNELYHKDVNQHTEKVQGLTYLSWAWAWAEVKKVDEKATVTIHEFPMITAAGTIVEGITVPYLKTPEGYFVKVSVTINGHTETEMLPVMDNKNVPLGTMAPQWVPGPNGKNVKEYAPTPMPTSFDINKSHKRCMVKAIALHGLGLYIYAGEDVPEKDVEADKKRQEEQEAQRQKLIKSIRETQRQTMKTKSEAVRKGLDDYVQELQTKAKVKVENMPLELLVKAENLVKIKLDELELAAVKPKEEVKA